jgi:hypothetical protein
LAYLAFSSVFWLNAKILHRTGSARNAWNKARETTSIHGLPLGVRGASKVKLQWL